MKELTKQTEFFRYFDPSDKHAAIKLGTCITRCLHGLQAESATPIILCIGTDRATGDCLGPLVGDQLLGYCQRAKCNDLPKVIGCLSAPVHALNIREVLQEIRGTYDRPFVIAVDASLGASSHVGLVTVSEGPLLPGKGVQKKLPAIGDISITGIVNVSGNHPGLLQSTRLYTVMQLANCIADALIYSIRKTFCYLDDFCPL